jgi:hypothetical protein
VTAAILVALGVAAKARGAAEGQPDTGSPPAMPPSSSVIGPPTISSRTPLGPSALQPAAQSSTAVPGAAGVAAFEPPRGQQRHVS